MPNELSTGDDNFRQPVVKPKFPQDEIQEMKEKVASSDGYVPNMGNFSCTLEPVEIFIRSKNDACCIDGSSEGQLLMVGFLWAMSFKYSGVHRCYAMNYDDCKR